MEIGLNINNVADNLPEFIKLVLKNEPIDETLIEKDGIPVSEEPEQPAEEPVVAKEKTSFFGKLFKH